MTECEREGARRRARRWYLANRERALASSKAWRLAHPEKYREYMRLGQRRYYRKHREKALAASRKYYWEHREQILERQRQRPRKPATPEQMERSRLWQRAHPEVVYAGVLRRRARLRGAPVNDLSTWMTKYLPSIFRNRCVYCGAETKLARDHVVPLSRSGNHTLSNVVPACGKCNRKKSNGPAPEFWWKRARSI